LPGLARKDEFPGLLQRRQAELKRSFGAAILLGHIHGRASDGLVETLSNIEKNRELSIEEQTPVETIRWWEAEKENEPRKRLGGREEGTQPVGRVMVQRPVRIDFASVNNG